MAANLDRAETSLTAVSDIAYIRGIDGSGNSVRISKADLANVLGGVVNAGNVGTGKDILSTVTKNGLYQFGTNTINSPTPEESSAQWYILAFKNNDGYLYIALRTSLISVYFGYSNLRNNWIGWSQDLIG